MVDTNTFSHVLREWIIEGIKYAKLLPNHVGASITTLFLLVKVSITMFVIFN
ncbi:MAG: hypothetical protein Q8S84_07960 [bacterium]|nr:hypothetical protein [bacterium]